MMMVTHSQGREAVSISRWLTLPHGRRLCWATWGDPAGVPCFVLHGWPGSRLVGALLHDLCRRRGVRLLAPDRPGFGRSAFQPGRRLLHWPGDLSAVADHLGLGRFAVVGISNGGPYALACGARLGERIRGLAVVSGMGPVSREEAFHVLAPQVQLAFRVNRIMPAASELIVWAMAFGARVWPQLMATQMRLAAPPPDRAVLDRPEVIDALGAEYAEAFRRGAHGPNHEIGIMRSPWGFNLSEVRSQVQLFHGEADANVPVTLGRQLANMLPVVRPRFVPGAGHYWYVDHFQQVLDSIGL